MKKYPTLEKLFAARGFEDFKWVAPRAVVVSHWVRMKCMYGCWLYGRCAACPPNVPSVPECRAFFDEYAAAAIFHFEKRVKRPQDRHAWTRRLTASLLEVEREVFLGGYHKAFLLPMDSCHLCRTCPPGRAECVNPKLARPTPEAMAVDVFATARGCGYPIEVVRDYADRMNRYAILLIE
jgi:predicted metal-binding protein